MSLVNAGMDTHFGIFDLLSQHADLETFSLIGQICEEPIELFVNNY